LTGVLLDIMIGDIRKRLSNFKERWQNSELFRKSFRNAGFSSAEYFLLQIMTLVATPFFVSRLGVDKYGIWMLANSVMGLFLPIWPIIIQWVS